MADKTTEGFVKTCGIEVEDYGGGHCTLSCRLDERHLNPGGTAHGGLLFTLMDTAAGIAAKFAHETQRDLVTLCADAHFLRPALPGKVIAKGELIKEGHRTGLASADVFDSEGKLLCHGDFEIFYTDNTASV